ncbi:hypothetical protein HF086_016283 [Spodoptera exigua]|uniref:CRAL-TRIO domain-containing protein n=1 Tax=Spodoptera exigua TaxID=7107 RepID=A0A922MHN4_SPOEX|nr:hypothetical protein HF086_016283 [Spodoptera exigua]
MENLQDTIILRFNPTTIEDVRRDLKLDSKTIAQMLDSFEEWISKQNHFTMKNFSEYFLKVILESIHVTLPRLLKNNYRVYMVKLTSDLGADTQLNYERAMILDGYACRISDIYIISSSKTVEVLTSLLKQLLSKKIAGRINVVKTLEELYEYVPKDMMPKDYGGNEVTIMEMYENWRSVLSTEENIEYLRTICNARSDEKHRLIGQYNDQILGIAGSFRTLSVD